MAPKAKAQSALKKKAQAAGNNVASTSQPQMNARRRDGTDPNDPVRIYADGKQLLIKYYAQELSVSNVYQSRLF
jgi:hypothetical protein